MNITSLNNDNLARISQLAGPFIDDVNIVVKGLLDHWSKTHKQSSELEPIKRNFVVSVNATPEGLPIKLELRANYRHRTFSATVESGGIRLHDDGKLYSAPSTAAIGLKQAVFGMDESSASTNGWTFWQYWDEATKQWEFIDRLRRSGR